MCNLSKGVEEKGIQKGILLSIRNLMETMGWPVEQVMEGLKIPEEEKRKYLDELKNEVSSAITVHLICVSDSYTVKRGVKVCYIEFVKICGLDKHDFYLQCHLNNRFPKNT